MTDPLTQSKLDELHHQLEAHRRVNNQNSERMRLVIHNQKKHLESISISNKLAIEKLHKSNRMSVVVAVICITLMGVLLYFNWRLQSRVDELQKTVQAIVVSSSNEMTRMKTKFQDLEQDQFETERKLDRTRKNLGSP
ncbi:MAG: hypothetical protein ACPGQS_03445 [Bradymonadia bacterium]